MGLRTIEQRITANEDFTGVAPTGVFTSENGMERYSNLTSEEANAVGGLFDFEQAHAIELKQVFFKLGGQAAWSLKLVTPEAVEVTLASGTNEAFYHDRALDLIMMPGDKLKVETTTATGALIARVTVATKVRL